MLTKHALINDIKMTWDEVGSGPPILLIHGFPLCRSLWRPQTAILGAAGYRVIAPDLRGFGHSDVGSLPCAISTYADDLVELLDHLEIRQTAAVGMSMGGYILFNLLERFPGRFSAAVFAVTRSLPDDENGRKRRKQLALAAQQQGPQAVADPFHDLLLSSEMKSDRHKLAEEVYGWMVETCSSGLTTGLLAMAGRQDATPLLSKVTIPCLAIGAAQDRAIPPEHSQMIADGIRDCQLAIIPDAGHLVNLERPGAFNKVVLEFLREHLPTPLNTDLLLCDC